jgi:transposase
VAQAARELDVAESVLRRWIWELTATPTVASFGNGQMGTGLAEIAALKKEVARLRGPSVIWGRALAHGSWPTGSNLLVPMRTVVHVQSERTSGIQPTVAGAASDFASGQLSDQNVTEFSLSPLARDH